MLHAYAREPAWSALVSEFSTHAVRDPVLAERLRRARDTFLDAVAAVIEAFAERDGVTFALPAREIARGIGALLRGLAVEWAIEPSLDRTTFEELFASCFRGLVVPLPEGSTP
jgi:hypothetical protein